MLSTNICAWLHICDCLRKLTTWLEFQISRYSYHVVARYSLYATATSESRSFIPFSSKHVQVQAPEKPFLAETRLIMFSVYYVCTRSEVTCASHKIYAQAMCSVYFSAHCDCEFYKRTFVIFAGVSVRPRKTYEKAETCVKAIAKMPYYIEACLLRSPYFVTFAALQAHTVQITLEPVLSDTVTYSTTMDCCQYVVSLNGGVPFVSKLPNQLMCVFYSGV